MAQGKRSDRLAPARPRRAMLVLALALASATGAGAQDKTSGFGSAKQAELELLFPIQPGDRDVPHRATELQGSKEELAKLAQRKEVLLWSHARLVKQARTLLAEPIPEMPPPPAIDMTCNDDPIVRIAAMHPADAYFKEVGFDELYLIRELTKVRAELAVLTFGEPGSDASVRFDVEILLAKRLERKLDILIERGKKKRDQVLAIVVFAVRTGRMLAMWGEDGAADGILSKAGVFAATFLPEMLEDLRQKHDYTQTTAITYLARFINLSGLSAGAVSADAVLDRIEAAMTFDLTLTLDLRSTGENGATEDWRLKAKIPLNYELQQVEGKATVTLPALAGEATGRYESYRESDGDLKMEAPDFPVLARIVDFNACAGTARLALDRFWAEQETYTTTGRDPDSFGLTMAEWGWKAMFEKHMKTGAAVFDLDLRNLDPEAIDMTVTGKEGVFSGGLTIQLDHKPK